MKLLYYFNFIATILFSESNLHRCKYQSPPNKLFIRFFFFLFYDKQWLKYLLYYFFFFVVHGQCFSLTLFLSLSVITMYAIFFGPGIRANKLLYIYENTARMAPGGRNKKEEKSAKTAAKLVKIHCVNKGKKQFLPPYTNSAFSRALSKIFKTRQPEKNHKEPIIIIYRRNRFTWPAFQSDFEIFTLTARLFTVMPIGDVNATWK